MCNLLSVKRYNQNTLNLSLEMHINYIKLPGLPKGIRVNEFSFPEELDKALGLKDATIELANNYINTYYLRPRAITILANMLERSNMLPRLLNERASTYIERFAKLARPNEIQAIADKIEPLQYLVENKDEPIGKVFHNHARTIFSNQNEMKWWELLRAEGIDIGPFTTDRESNIMLLAQGLQRYNTKQMEQKFV